MNTLYLRRSLLDICKLLYEIVVWIKKSINQYISEYLYHVINVLIRNYNTKIILWILGDLETWWDKL